MRNFSLNGQLKILVGIGNSGFARILACTVGEKFVGGGGKGLAAWSRRGLEILEGVVHLVESLLEGRETGVEILGTFDDDVGRLHHFVLVGELVHVLPGEVKHAEEGIEVGRPSDEDSFVICILPKRGIVGEGKLKGALREHVHDDDVDALVVGGDIAGVVLAGQFVGMAAHRGDMGLESEGTCVFVIAVAVVFIVLDGHLGVDDDVAFVGEMEDNVGLEAVSLLGLDGLAGEGILHCFLGFELFALGEPHVLKELGEAHLSEISLRLVFGGEGVGETVGAVAEIEGLLEGEFDCLVETGDAGGVLLVAPVDKGAQIVYILLEGREQRFEPFLVDVGELLGTPVEHFLGGGLHLGHGGLELTVELFSQEVLLLLGSMPGLLADFVHADNGIPFRLKVEDGEDDRGREEGGNDDEK